MHTLSSTFVLGYHGCDQETAEQLLSGKEFKPSYNGYDWLGHGIYFWESNPLRGLEYASQLKRLKRRPSIRTPAVVGAVIDLGLCLDLTTSLGLEQVRIAHAQYIEIAEAAGEAPPQNHPDGLRRYLDCAVLETVHGIRGRDGEPPIETVKGIFIEGPPIYDTAGFHTQTHTQICVRNAECIKGVFRVPIRHLE